MAAPTQNVDTWGVRDWARDAAMRARTEAGERIPDFTPGRPLLEWAQLVPERGLPINLDDFPFQRELLSQEVADAREVVMVKSTQVGATMILWRWAAYRADNGDRVIYFFPTKTHVTDFGDERIEPSIEDSEYLSSRVPRGGVRRKTLKEIGAGTMSLRGVHSRLAVQSVDADALVFDEYDELDQKNLTQAERRLSGARAAGRAPRTRRIGIPTVPGFGMDLLFQRTDQRVWMVTCADCGLEQQVTWEGNLRWRTEPDGPILRAGRDEYDDPDRVAETWRACAECDASLEGPGGPIYTGRWVPQNPGARVIGFHVSRLIVPLTDLDEIVRNSRKTKPHEVEAFYNNDLGQAYAPAEAALTDEDLDAASAEGFEEMQMHRRGASPYTMGVDVADERDLTVRISEHLPDGRRRCAYLAEPKNFEEVVRLIQVFRPEMVVIDSQPSGRYARWVASLFPGRVALVRYDETNPDADAFRYDPEKNKVTVNRTEAIDAMMDSVRQGKNILLKRPPPKYREQMKAPKRRTVLDTRDRPRRIYVSTGTMGDDYAHAEVYDLVAAAMLRQRRAQEVAAQMASQPLTDEQLGIQRVRLEGGDPAQYYSGFRSGGWGE